MRASSSKTAPQRSGQNAARLQPQGVISFANSSRIVIGHFRTEGDVDQ